MFINLAVIPHIRERNALLWKMRAWPHCSAPDKVGCNICLLPLSKNAKRDALSVDRPYASAALFMSMFVDVRSRGA